MAPELRCYGVQHPVEYLVSPDGIVLHKYFVENYQHRVTATSVALKHFGEPAADAPVTGLNSGALAAQIGLASGRAFAGQEVSFFARPPCSPAGTSTRRPRRKTTLRSPSHSIARRF